MVAAWGYCGSGGFAGRLQYCSGLVVMWLWVVCPVVPMWWRRFRAWWLCDGRDSVCVCGFEVLKIGSAYG